MSPYPSKKIVERLREQYPKGCRVELDCMNDRQAPPTGTRGTVIYVDDIGVAFGEDQCHQIGKEVMDK